MADDDDLLDDARRYLADGSVADWEMALRKARAIRAAAEICLNAAVRIARVRALVDAGLSREEAERIAADDLQWQVAPE